jgi:hypothetical protein
MADDAAGEYYFGRGAWLEFLWDASQLPYGWRRWLHSCAVLAWFAAREWYGEEAEAERAGRSRKL